MKYENYKDAIMANNMNEILWLKKNKYKFDNNTFSYASLKGNIKIIKWLYKNNCHYGINTFNFGLINGNLENLKWLYKNNCVYDSTSFIYATINGNIKNMEWLLDIGCKINNLSFRYSNKITTLKWLYDNGSNIDSYATCLVKKNSYLNYDFSNYISNEEITNQETNLELLQWLRSIKCCWNNETFNYAVLNGDIQIIKWLYKNNCPYSFTTQENKIISSAIKFGSISNIIWLIEHYCPINENMMSVAAQCGHIHIIKWLDKIYNKTKINKYCNNSEIFYNAALNGNLENMKWLKNKNYVWNERTFEAAALNGNLENMKWLKDNNCPWNKMTFEAVALNGNYENLVWLIDNKCPNDEKIIKNAIISNNLENLKLLYEYKNSNKNTNQNINLSNYITDALKNNNYSMVKWILEKSKNKYENILSMAILNCCDYKIINFIIENKYDTYDYTNKKNDLLLNAIKNYCDYQIIKLIITNNYDYLNYDNKKTLLSEAIKIGDIDIIKLLYQNGYNLSGSELEIAIKLNNSIIIEWIQDNKPIFYNNICNFLLLCK